VQYDANISRLDEVLLSTTANWTLTRLQQIPGYYRGRLTSSTNAVLGGEIFQLDISGYIGDTNAGVLNIRALSDYGPCVGVLPGETVVVLDSICGLNFRLIERITSKYSLEQNAPNPFSDRCTIRFSVGLDGDTRLVLYNSGGHEVGRLIDEYLDAGSYQVEIDGSVLSSGVYTCRLEQGSVIREIRVVRAQ
jgi:hypothetical protein